VLAGLSTHGKQRQIDVAESTSIDVSTMSRLVTRLVSLGLVSRTRSDTNNREVIVELTPTGRALVNRLIPRARELEGEAIAGIPAADLAITRETLRRMYRNMAAGGEGAEEPQPKLAKSG
jgi:DNA-binding MarR family transcriptional regulator